jgi:hypothetical protein
MKKTLLLLILGSLTLVVISCGSNDSNSTNTALIEKPVGNVLGNEILAISVELGRIKKVDCSEALKNKEIEIEASKMAGGSLQSYAKWIQSESGQKALQDVIAKCTAQ